MRPHISFASLIKSANEILSSSNTTYQPAEILELLGHTFKISRTQLLADLHHPVSSITKITKFNRLIDEFAQGKPIPRIIKQTQFMGLPLKLNHGVLIPRPETEGLVEHILSFCSEKKLTAPSILELGYGSGCILLSLASKIPNSTCIGWDISKRAYVNAKQNKLNLSCKNVLFVHSNFFKTKDINRFIIPNQTIFVSNPPYIPSNDIKNLDPSVLNHDPITALNGGKDGLSFYKRCLIKFKDKDVHQFYEIGVRQKPSIRKLLQQYGYKTFKFYDDYTKRPRFLYVQSIQ